MNHKTKDSALGGIRQKKNVKIFLIFRIILNKKCNRKD